MRHTNPQISTLSASCRSCARPSQPSANAFRDFGVSSPKTSAHCSPEPHARAIRADCASPIPLLRKTRWEAGEGNDGEVYRYLEEHGGTYTPDGKSQVPSSGCSECDGEADSKKRCAGVPVFVMLPLDTVKVVHHPDGTSESCIQNELSLDIALQTLKSVGVQGVMVDVWWGIVERKAPGDYDFAAYSSLFEKIGAAGLQLQAVMSFHAAGSNVGDTCTISLPSWVHDVGDRNADIFFTDRGGVRNRECISVACADEPVFWGHTPLQVYEAFVRRFCDEFEHLFGEARYPAYPEGDRRWRFPGVGEFQCYDGYMLKSLRANAEAANRPEWGYAGPHDSGTYCSRAEQTGFFHPDCGNWRSEYGHFFLSWYSGLLINHVDKMVAMGNRVLSEPRRPRLINKSMCVDKSTERFELRPPVRIGIKLAGVHWGYRTPSHAAEMTAGYYNTMHRDGYAPFFKLLSDYNGGISFTCVEMRDCEHPPESACSPEDLLRQILHNSKLYGVPLTGENALQRYDHTGLRRIRESALADRCGGIHQLTFLRMGNLMFDHWGSFTHLVSELSHDDED